MTFRPVGTEQVVGAVEPVHTRAHGIGEDEAYARLRQTAMNEKRKIADIAQSLVTAAPLLEK